ncbi:MAG: hypothetical protein MPJ50_14875 [Pirellulales bacterium]|nr:hypothetical protein [Pirellulales bacterium]
MTVRERWTVYPLLFLTLGLVMRDRMERRPIAPQNAGYKMRELQIVDENGNIQYSLSNDGWNPQPPGSATEELRIEDLFRRGFNIPDLTPRFQNQQLPMKSQE